MASVNPFSSTFKLPPINSEKKESVIPAPNLRVHGVTIYRPIIYGNITYKLPSAPEKTLLPTTRGNHQDENQDWYRWTVYVRGVENEDLSYFIKKVVFYIHDSFASPVRVIEKSPFELTEIGMLTQNHSSNNMVKCYSKHVLFLSSLFFLIYWIRRCLYLETKHSMCD